MLCLSLLVAGLSCGCGGKCATNLGKNGVGCGVVAVVVVVCFVSVFAGLVVVLCVSPAFLVVVVAVVFVVVVAGVIIIMSVFVKWCVVLVLCVVGLIVFVVGILIVVIMCRLLVGGNVPPLSVLSVVIRTVGVKALWLKAGPILTRRTASRGWERRPPNQPEAFVIENVGPIPADRTASRG